MTKQLTYIAGDIMDRGAQLKRAEERDLLTQAGINVYTPQDNASINDKQNAVAEGLAERIVREDVERLMLADSVVIEPRAHAQGTLIELGQLHGMKMLARELYRIDCTSLDDREFAVGVSNLMRSVLDKKVYPHDSDIRRHNTPEIGDRRSYAPNQYLYGVVLDLTDGHGYYEFEDAVKAIKDNELEAV